MSGSTSGTASDQVDSADTNSHTTPTAEQPNSTRSNRTIRVETLEECRERVKNESIAPDTLFAVHFTDTDVTLSTYLGKDQYDNHRFDLTDPIGDQ